MTKLHVALIFGGNSSEHDVSKRSAHNIYDAMDKEKYDVSLFGITKDGIFLDAESSQRIFNGEAEETVVADFMKNYDATQPLAPIAALNSVNEIDVFFPIVHGNLGEDGTLQGLLRLLNKPYVGSAVRGMAMSFDKEVTKRLVTAAGIRNSKYVTVTPQTRHDFSYETVSAELGTTLFVKAANQGSSVGISRVTNPEEFETALDDSFQYDRKVIIEEALKGTRELEISILGNENPIASQIGSLAVPHQGESDIWYDYNNKFVDASQVMFELPVKLPAETAQEITEMSLAAYRALDLTGMARMDFFLDENDVPYFGEPNTLPGFTNVSLYPQLWEVSGISYTELIDRLIELAQSAFKENAQLSYAYTSLTGETDAQFTYNQDN